MPSNKRKTHNSKPALVNLSSAEFCEQATRLRWEVGCSSSKPDQQHSVATRDGVKIQHWAGTGTVATTLTHPKWSKETHWNKDLYRYNLSREHVIEVLENPRAHTQAGNYVPRKRVRRTVDAENEGEARADAGTSSTTIQYNFGSSGRNSAAGRAPAELEFSVLNPSCSFGFMGEDAVQRWWDKYVNLVLRNHPLANEFYDDPRFDSIFGTHGRMFRIGTRLLRRKLEGEDSPECFRQTIPTRNKNRSGQVKVGEGEQTEQVRSRWARTEQVRSGQVKNKQNGWQEEELWISGCLMLNLAGHPSSNYGTMVVPMYTCWKVGSETVSYLPVYEAHLGSRVKLLSQNNADHIRDANESTRLAAECHELVCSIPLMREPRTAQQRALDHAAGYSFLAGEKKKLQYEFVDFLFLGRDLVSGLPYFAMRDTKERFGYAQLGDEEWFMSKPQKHAGKNSQACDNDDEDEEDVTFYKAPKSRGKWVEWRGGGESDDETERASKHLAQLLQTHNVEERVRRCQGDRLPSELRRASMTTGSSSTTATGCSTSDKCTTRKICFFEFDDDAHPDKCGYMKCGWVYADSKYKAAFMPCTHWAVVDQQVMYEDLRVRNGWKKIGTILS